MTVLEELGGEGKFEERCTGLFDCIGHAADGLVYHAEEYYAE